jgi:hypothetical protein
MLDFRPDTTSRLAATVGPLMAINGGYNLSYECADHTPMVLAIHVRPEEAAGTA